MWNMFKKLSVLFNRYQLTVYNELVVSLLPLQCGRPLEELIEKYDLNVRFGDGKLLQKMIQCYMNVDMLRITLCSK